jgi:hypothetical protein
MSEIKKETSIESYLRGLGHACLEGADRPQTRTLLYQILRRAPAILLQLLKAEQQAQKRAA